MVAFAMATFVAVTGCSSTEEQPMDANLTREKAQARVIAYLTDALSLLPPQASLSRRYPSSPTGNFGPGTLVPCTNDAPRPDTPVNYAVNYWVVGVTTDDAAQQVDALVRGWKERGWDTNVKPRDNNKRSAIGAAPDGYKITADINKYGDLSLAGGSPCFPPPPRNEVPDAPETIAHP